MKWAHTEEFSTFPFSLDLDCQFEEFLLVLRGGVGPTGLLDTGGGVLRPPFKPVGVVVLEEGFFNLMEL